MTKSPSGSSDCKMEGLPRPRSCSRGNLHLTEDATGVGVERAQQLNAATVLRERTAERLAIDGQQLEFLAFQVDLLADPFSQGMLQRWWIDFRKQITKRAAGRPASEVPQQIPHLGQLGVNPLGDRFVASYAAQHGTDDGDRHGRKRVTPSLSATRIGNVLEPCQQAPRVSNIHDKTSEIPRAKRSIRSDLLRNPELKDSTIR
jgi:hypothetical protein